MATHDPLTGLMQVHVVHEHLELAITKAQCLGRNVAVLFVDLDGFHRVNDQFGRAAGDHLLRSVANSMRGIVREGDLVGRIGGDQFLMLLDDLAGSGAAEEAARRILLDLRRPVIHLNDLLPVSASIGIALSPDHGTKPDSLQQAANAAMKQVKKSGRNGFAFSGIAPVISAEDLSTSDTWRNVHVLRQG
jgi:diguanylate cyclase (GGDEF)-like protein